MSRHRLVVGTVLCVLAYVGGAAVMSQQASTQGGLDETIKVYGAAWGERDVARRRKLLEQTLTTDATYTDPTGHAGNRDALVEHIGVFQQKFPGHRIAVTSHADVHHSVARFTWTMTSPEGKIVIEGLDLVELAPDGRLRRIVGFFGPTKPLN